MRTKHNDGTITFEPDAYERRCSDTVIGMFTTLSVAASSDLQEKAGEAVKIHVEVMAMLAKQNAPQSPDDAQPETLTDGLGEQSPGGGDGDDA